MALAALPPLSLYVHIPWCVRKCPYCDFNSHEARGDIPEREYVASLVADLELALPQVWGRPVHTVFFGGGTPSLLSARALDDLLSAIRARLPLAPDAEITLEANPGTFEAQKFADFRAAGVNRLSIGIQSFHPAHLQALGRIHDGAQARAAIEIAQASFDNFNLDLMYALPGQTVEQALADFGTAIGFGPVHISAYHLTIEPNTYFYRHPPQIPDQDVAADMQEAIETRLASAGYRHYETSASRRSPPRVEHGTTLTTGPSAIISGSAPARTASSRSPTASCDRCASSIRATTSRNGRRRAGPAGTATCGRRAAIRVHDECAAAH